LKSGSVIAIKGERRSVIIDESCKCAKTSRLEESVSDLCWTLLS